MKTLLVDNYDSFTFNLFQLVAEVNGEEPLVVRNDGATWEELTGWGFDNIVISPGPGTPGRPADFGVCADVIRHANVPLLGVCLGHQGIGHVAGGEVVRAPEAMHGRLSAVLHDGQGLFAGIPQGFRVVRYHSLCLERPLPDGLAVTAWTEDGIVMGLRDLRRPRWGVQFHPESISTEHGHRLLENFRQLTATTSGRAPSQVAVGRTIVPHRPAVEASPAGGSRYRVLVRRVEEAPDPESVFVHLFSLDPLGWWLDSSRDNHGSPTYSFMGGGDGPLSGRAFYDVGARSVTVVRAGETVVLPETTIFDYLERELERFAGVDVDVPFDFDCGFVGYLGYEVKADCGGSIVHTSTMPDAMFQLADRVIAFEHATGAAYLLCLVDDETADAGEEWLDGVQSALATLPTARPVAIPDDAPPAEAFLARSRDTYLADIERCLEYLVEGESYEICLTNKLQLDVGLEPLSLYRTLRRLNPAPFSAFLRVGQQYVACSSPERFLRVGRDRWVEAKPIKGTARRGLTLEEDAALAAALRADEKTQAENLMITDLLRNDLGMVCEVGSVHVPALFAVETYETVHQLVSTVRGRLRADLVATDCIRACFPGGSMTGAPKKRTMEIIDDLEDEARGVYSGAIGYLGLGGASDLNIVIRTIVFDGDQTTIGVGGAIVMQSDPVDEFDEIMLKGQALLRAITVAQASDPRPVDGRPSGHGRDPADAANSEDADRPEGTADPTVSTALPDATG